MNKIRRYIAFVFMLTFMTSCKNDPFVLEVGPVANANLIHNSSFEANGKPTPQDWGISPTFLSKFVQDAPPRGGKYSLGLLPGWVPGQCLATTFISGQSGTGIFVLTVSMKINHNGLLLRPSVRFGILAHNQWVKFKSVSTDSINWTTVTIIDTMLLLPNDTLAVQLAGGATESAYGITLFDVVNLERVK